MLLEKWLLTVQPSTGGDIESLYMFGDNTWGQLGTENTVFKSSPVLIGTQSWSQVASGLSHTIGIRSDGKLFGWGANTYGQLGNNDLTLAHRSSPVQIGVNNWSAVSTNGDTSYAINNDGLMFAWGLGFNGQLGNNSMLSSWAANSWTQVLAGNTIGIESDGTMWAIGGINSQGQLGLNDTVHRSSPVQIGTSTWSALGGSGGTTRTALRSDSTLWVWGSAGQGQGGNNNTNNLSSPTLTGSLTSVQIQQSYVSSIATTQLSWTAVSYGAAWSMFAIRNDGALFAWGLNTYGNLGLNDIVRRSSPVQVGTSSWSSVSANGFATLAIRADNTLWSWGYNAAGQLGSNNIINRSSPVQVGTATIWSKVITNGAVSQDNVAAIDTNGALWVWGNNTNGQLGLNDVGVHRSSPVQLGTSSWTMVSAGSGMTAAITTTGNLFTWGVNTNGQLGDTTLVAKSSPIQIGTSSWTMVTSGTSVTMGITTDGALYSWGTGTYLGEGLGINKSSPVQITSIRTSAQQQTYLTTIGVTPLSWTTVANLTFTTGSNTRLALRSDGLLFSWGQNTIGQLGLNDLVHRSSPVQIGTSSWAAIAGGTSYAAAIKIDGTLWTWGRNDEGSLGQNNQIHRSSPVQVGTDTDWIKLASGSSIGPMAAIKSGGGLWAWGANTVGQLGLNDAVNRSSPVQVGSSSWTMVASGTNFGTNLAAIRTDGALFIWGDNTLGQLGFNDAVARSSPVQLGTSSWTMVALGGSFTGAISSNGALFTWGANGSGQLGAASSVHRSSPVQVGTNTWNYVNSWTSTMYGIRNDGALFAWGLNTNGELGDNTTANKNSPVLIGSSSWTFVNGATAIDSNGVLFTWAGNTQGGVGDNTILQRSSPVFIRAGIFDSWTYVSSGTDEYGAVRSDGLLFRWGYNGFGALGGNPGNQSLPLQVTTSSWTIVPAGSSGGMGITSAGQLYTWGIGTDGQIGDGNMVTMSTPVFIRSMNDSWTSIGEGSFNSNHVAGIRNDNTLWLWGLGTSGQLGQNNVINRSQPIQLGKDLLSWTYLSGSSMPVDGTQTAAGIRSDGSLWSWGSNTYGQLGTNNQIHRSSPVQIGTSSWTMVSAGQGFLFAIRSSDKSLWSWGTDNSLGALGANVSGLLRSSPVQVGTSSWNMVSAGRLTPIAIRIDGTLWAWGFNNSGQIGDNTVVARSSPVQIGNLLWTSAVSGLDSSSYGIRLDGTLWSWGKNTVGELGENDGINRSSPVQIGTGSWKQLAAGFGNAFSIDTNNYLWSWGLNSQGQLGLNDTVHRSSPVQVGTSSWIMVSAGQSGDIGNAYVVSAIRSDGALFTWGNNTYGGLGDNSIVNKSSPVQIGSSSWTMVAGRMGIIQDYTNGNGYLYAWGGNTVGELGINSVVDTSSPVQVNATINTWYQVAQGDTFTAAIRNDKTLWSWGNNDVGQLGDNTVILKSSPVQVGTSSWTMISTGSTHTLALTMDNVLYGWGNNDNGQLGTGNAPGTILLPVIISSLITLADEIAWSTSTGKPRTLSWTTVTAGASTSFAIRSDSKLFAWGTNSIGQLGLNDILHRSSPVQIGTSNWSGIAAGISHTYAIRSDGLLFVWGGNFNGQLGLNDLVHRSSPVQLGTSSWSVVPSNSTTNATSTFAITLDGKLYGWGVNGSGNLGVNDIIARSSPVQVGTGNSWTLVTANGNSTFAIRTDSKLFAWGLNTAGELGIGDSISRSSPVQLGTSNWNIVATQASGTTAGIMANNTLYTWGSGSGGALGDRTVVARNSPVQIVSFSSPAEQQAYLTKTSKTGYSWSTVVNTNNTMFAIRNDGLLFAWGNNINGALGLNDIVHRSSPVQVGTNSWLTVSAGASFTAAIRSDNTLWTWGVNTAGTVGDGTQAHRSSPVQVGTSSWTAVATGPFNTTGGTVLAVRSDGTLWSWGANDVGQLGLNTVVARSSPVQIGTENTWSKVYSANNRSNAIRTTGALYAWGVNTFGQLGDGTALNRSSPVQIGSSSWTAVASGLSWTVAILSDGSLFTWGAGTSGVLGTPDSTQHRSSPVQIGTSSWSVVTAGGTVTAGISGNLLYMWGSGANAQFGNNSLVNTYFSPTLTTGTSSWTTVNAGSAIVALDANGQMFTWGTTAGGDGVIGNGVVAGRSSPVFIRSVADSWTAIGTVVAGLSGIRSDGLLFAWGNNTAGSLGDGTTVAKSFPVQIGANSWTMVTGYTNILGITAADTGNALFTWGLGTSGELGILGITSRSSPVFIRSMNDSWISVGAGQSLSSAIRSDGKLFTWGINTTFGQLGDNSTTSKSYPTQIGNNSDWASVSAAGSGITNAITTTGIAYIWGNNTNGALGLAFNPTTISGSWLEHRSSPVQVGATPYSNSPTQIGASSWSQVSAGISHVLAISSTNKLFAWGNNSSYQVNNEGLHRSSPVQLGTSSWSQISAGNVHSLAIASDNTLYGWGLQYQQWPYNPTLSPTNFILPVNSPTSWSILTGQNLRFTGIRSDGSLWTWGANESGQLGLSDIFHRSSPVQVGSSSWIQVNSETSWTTAIRSDGTLWAWGNNNDGYLGLNDLVHRSSPVQIGTDTTWSKVGGLGAIRNDGSLWTWGLGTSGQLGDSTILSRSSPVQIGTSSWTLINSKAATTMAGIRSDGLLFTWGINGIGGLGLNDTVNKSSPTQVGSIYSLAQQNSYLTATGTTTFSWSVISSGGVNGMTAAIRNDGALFTWGTNNNGGVGDNTIIHRSSPVQIGTSSWTQVAVGDFSTYAIRNDGALFVWGLNTSGQLGTTDVLPRSSPVQIGTSSWTSVAAGISTVTAIRLGGALFAWGINASGQLGLGDLVARSSPLQVGTSSWTQVSTNGAITAALRSDGGLFTWGINTNGQLGDNTVVSKSSPVKLGAGSWSQIAVGYSHMVGLLNNNTLWSWGINTNGGLGLTNVLPRSSPVQIGTSSWTSVNAGNQYSVAIRSDNTLWGWGLNTNGQLGDSTAISRSSPVQIGTSTWYKVSGLYINTAAIDNTSRQLFVWGQNAVGAIGNNTVTQSTSPVFIRTANESWSQVSMNVNTAAAIRSDSLLFVWGQNANGQLGLGDLVHRSSATQLGTSSWSQITVGQSHMVGLTSTKLLYTWGGNGSGELGINSVVATSSPTLVSLSSWSIIGTGSTNSYGVLDGNLLFYGWGSGASYGAIGDNTVVSKSSPVQIASYQPMPTQITGDTWSKISAGYSHNVGIKTNNKLYGWGNPAANTFTAYSWTALSSSAGHFAGIRSDGALFTWGNNAVGNLGDDTILHRSSPVQIGTSSWTTVSAGGITAGTDFTTLALTADNVLYGWGAGASGQLGQLFVANKSSPVQISSFTNNTLQSTYLTATGKTGFSWTKINAGGSIGSSAAIRSDGALFTWGINSFGQLGQNSTVNTNSPIQLGTTSWSQISIGNNAMYAIRNDNTLWSWGLNTIGQLGQNDLVHRSSPVQVGTSSWTIVSGSVATGTLVSTLACVGAIRSDGALFTWGNNNAGQLGDGTILHRSSPVQVGTSSWTKVSAGDVSVYAIRLDGALFSWGDNTSGQLGSTTIVPRSSPVQIGTSSWSSVSAGLSYAMAIRTNSTLWSWGINANGQLGDNTILPRSSPVQIGTSSWSVISTGFATTTALRLDNTLWSWGINTNGQLGDNTILPRSSPVQIGTSSWSQVSIGTSPGVTMALTYTDNQLFIWGQNNNGQLGLSESLGARSSPVFIRSINESWNAVSSGGTTSYGIRIDNLLFAWGLNASGQIGDTTIISRSAPVQIGASSWAQISAGVTFVGGITSDNRLFTWGINTTGQLGDTTVLSRSSPVQVGTSWNIVSAGQSSTSAINTNNLLYVWGGNASGQLGDRSIANRSSPVQVNSFTSAEIQQTYLTTTSKPAALSWNTISTGLSTSAAIRSDGALFMWGLGTSGQLGLNDTISRSSPVQIGTSSWTAVGLFTTSTVAIRIDGGLFTWGDNASGQLASNNLVHRSSPVQVGTSSWTTVSSSTGLANFMALDATNKLWAWGINTNGELAQNDTVSRSSPVQIGVGTVWTSISKNTSRGAIRSDGALFMWGLGTNGQIGDNAILSRSSPVQIGTNSWSIISAGSVATAAITSDGLLYVWGNNASGQLGTNDVILRSSPVQLGTISWTSVSSGVNYMAGVRSDNLLFTWGLGTSGQLGDSTIISKSSPIQIGTSSWAMVSAGGLFTIGLDQLYGLYTWGTNTNGELGINSVTSALSPIFLPTATDSWTITSTTGASQFAIRSDGYLFTWGNNANGQLGLLDILSRSAPVQLGTSIYTNLNKGGSNINSSMATRNDNKLYVWGLNTSGQLGLNDRISKSSPVQLGTNQAYTPPNMYSVPTQIGTSSWTQVSANFNSTFVIDPNNVLYEWGFNDNRPLIPAITSVGYSAVTVSNGFNHFGFTK